MSLRLSTFKKALVSLLLFACAFSTLAHAQAQRRRTTTNGSRTAVVVDERLAALRDAPELSANLLKRLSRGRVLFITGARRSSDGLIFYRVMATKRTGGWLQADAVATTAREDGDERLLRLIRGSEDFDRIARARIFLDLFTRSPLRPAVLMLYGEASEAAAEKLSRDAARRLDEREMAAGGAPGFSYFMNYNGLDRYRRQGISFIFDRERKRFHYDGESWREILRRYPRSPEAEVSRKRLDSLSSSLAAK